MKIVYITDSFAPESVGGAGQVALDMASGMMARGHSIDVITTTQNKEGEGVSTYAGISVHRIYAPRTSQFVRSYLSANNPFIRSATLSIIQKLKPDIVHAHNVHEHFSFAALRWIHAIGIPVFITLHDTLSFAYTRLYHFIDSSNAHQRGPFDYRVPILFTIRQVGKAFNPFRRWSIRRSLRSAHAIFSVSDALGNALRQNGIQNVTTLYNGVEPLEFQASDSEVVALRERLGFGNRPIVLFGGRAMQDKGSEVLINTLPQVLKSHPGALVVMAIERGGYRDSLIRYAEQKGASHALRCIDLLHERERAALFSAATIVVVPSIYFDPAPLMVMQAMSAGKPVVGTRFGGTPEIIADGVTGFVVNPFDADGMAETISKLLGDDELRQRMGVAGRERVEAHFTRAIHTQRALEWYERALLRGCK